MSQLLKNVFPNQSQPFIFWKIEQLQDIDGFTPELYLRLKDYITVLPEVTPINVFHGIWNAFAKFESDITSSDISKIMADRQQKKTYHSVSDWITQEKFISSQLPTDLLTLTSSYFNLSSTVTAQAIIWKNIFYCIVLFKK